MTSPQPVPAEEQGPPVGEDAVVAALEAALLEGTLVAGTAIPLFLLLLLTRLGADRRAARAAIRLGLTDPVRIPHGIGLTGTAAAQVAGEEPRIRARYIVDAAKRITRSLGLLGDDPKSLFTAIKDERRFWRQHLDAGRNRRRAAQAVDRVALTSPWLQWKTVMDGHAEQECLDLDGTRFTADQPPRIDGRRVYPGAVHPNCRCTAVSSRVTPIRASTTAT